MPSISAYYGSSGLPKPERPHCLCLLSVEASERAPTQRPMTCSPCNALVLSLSGALPGLGCYIGMQLNNVSAANASVQWQLTPTPVYSHTRRLCMCDWGTQGILCRGYGDDSARPAGGTQVFAIFSSPQYAPTFAFWLLAS